MLTIDSILKVAKEAKETNSYIYLIKENNKIIPFVTNQLPSEVEKTKDYIAGLTWEGVLKSDYGIYKGETSIKNLVERINEDFPQ